MVELGEIDDFNVVGESRNKKLHLQNPNKKFYRRFGEILDEPSRLVFMRHATSEMNESLDSKNKEKAHLGYFDIALDPELKDAVISEEGKKEVQAQRELLKTLNIKLIVTSPMRRAIMTSLETGLDVPIVCLPDLRERMSYKNTWVHSKKAI
jgi:broad specificity phosphatase PhoE